MFTRLGYITSPSFYSPVSRCLGIWYGWNRLFRSIHGSRLYITHIQRNFRTPYIDSNIKGGKTSKSFFTPEYVTYDAGFL